MANAVTQNYLNRIVMQPAAGGDEGCERGREGGGSGFGRTGLEVGRWGGGAKRTRGNRKGRPAICVSLEREMGDKKNHVITIL